MRDRDFLLWIHDRLVIQHKDNELSDYMHKLRSIIWAMDPEQDSPPSPFNSADEMRGALKMKKILETCNT